MSETGLKMIEYRLREFLQQLDFSIATARRAVEINQQIVSARQEYPGDPVLIQAAFALSSLESLRGRLFELFPILRTSDEKLASAKEV